MGSRLASSNNKTEEVILEAENISKRFGNTLAVNSLSLSVLSGEIIALLGESGSGKTTLLRIIAGFEKPTDGRLALKGCEISSRKRFIEPEKRAIGMVFQDYALFPHLTVAANVRYGLHQWSGPVDKQTQLENMLALVGLSDLESRYPHELSGGQQQRVALARAIAPEPELLLLDEPFSNLDEGLKAQVRKDLKGLLNKLGITAVFVTHDTKDALATADRVVMLKDGVLQQLGTPIDLYRRPANEYVASYFGPINWLLSNNNQLMNSVADDIKVGIRPVDFNLIEGNHENTKEVFVVEGTVVALSFMGEYWEVLIETEEQGDLLAWLYEEPDVVLGIPQKWGCLKSKLISVNNKAIL